MLLHIVRDAVVRYLDDAKADIRRAAVVTSISVLDKVAHAVESTSESFMLIAKTIDRLLVIGVGDDDPALRACVFDSLVPSLDLVVSRSRNISYIVEALNDEARLIRRITC